MRMNLHSMSKVGFIVAFVIFAVVFLISIIVGATGSFCLCVLQQSLYDPFPRCRLFCVVSRFVLSHITYFDQIFLPGPGVWVYLDNDAEAIPLSLDTVRLPR